jgi:curved DNA-binding protein CbpA
LDSAELERIRRARRQLDRLKARNYFQVLELSLDTTDEKVRESYLHKVKDVHPDMLDARDPQELKQLHAETFRVVQAAYEALKTAPRRREYLKFIQEGIEEEVTDGSRILEAEALFQQGRIQLKRRAWDSATEAFQRALDLNPDEGEYALYLGMAKVRQAVAGNEGAISEAEDLLHRARMLLPSSPEPYYYLGRLSLVRGDQERAASYFESALARRPNHVEAIRELRLIKMRNEKKGGVLGTLLGRKDKP